MQAGLIRPELSGEQAVPASCASASLCARVASCTAAAPDRLAVTDGTTHLSRADLEHRADRLAAYLQEAGAAPEVCIGLFLERSVDFVTAALAVLKTGAAYLPLDPSTPAERLGFILADAGAPLLLTHRGKARSLSPGPWQVVDLDSLQAAGVNGHRPAPVHVEPDPGDLAYVIYTSGSTGRPKGVEITHANLAHFIAWHQSAFGVTEADRAAQVAGLGFDVVGWELWPHLTAGASLHIADEPTRRSAQALRDWLVAERITISFVPTVLAEQLIHESWPAETALRTMLTGGDTLHRRPLAGLPFVLVNNYGPAECTVVATSGVVTPAGDAHGHPSIGRPLPNTQALILDETLRPVPLGEVGELCLAGPHVGRGYRNNPELTASRFVHYCPPSGPLLRIYRTGDQVRLLPGGEIAFLGRLDDQVKIRGYRIELGEVAASLDRCPSVEACAVTARQTCGGPVLVAYVIVSAGARVTSPDLRKFLAARLPDYMIPAQFVALPTLPLTANGKLDRAALPVPGPDNLLPDRLPEDADPAAGSGNALQQQIAGLVASLLSRTSIGLEENFFLAGGHSLLGVQLLARLKDLFGVRLTLRQLFQAPTVAALVAEVARLSKKTS